MDRGRTLAPVNCTRIEKVYLNSRLLTPPHPRISSGRPINYAFSHCSRNEQSNRWIPLAAARQVFLLFLPDIDADPEWRGEGKKDEKKEDRKGEDGGEKRGNERRRGRRRISRNGCLLPPPFCFLPPLPSLVAFTALKQWAYISWAAHACEIVLIYRWAITRSHILGSRLHVGLAAQLSWRKRNET